MKYSAVILACVLAVAAAAEYNNGQYIPEKQNNNRYNQYRPSRYQSYQNKAYKPLVSSTPFPSLFVSSTPVPVTASPARSTTLYYASSTSKPVFNVPAELPKPSVEPTSWSSRASWPTVSSESVQSVQSELSVAPTQASLSASASPSIAPTVAEVEAPVVSVVPAARLASAVQVTLAPQVYSVTPEASVTPIYQQAKYVSQSLPTGRWASNVPVVQVTPAPQVVSVTPVAPAAPVYPQAKIVPTARWAGDARAAETLRYSNQINNDGAFQYSYETNNGIVAEEQGSPRSFYSGEDQVAPVVAQGSFGWISPEGQQITISYVADETGYHPSGSAIPEVPPQIARALAYIASRNLQA